MKYWVEIPRGDPVWMYPTVYLAFDKGFTVADLGFPRGGAPTLKGGANLLFALIFPETVWKWRILAEGGGRVPGTPLDPPLVYKTFKKCKAKKCFCSIFVTFPGNIWRNSCETFQVFVMFGNIWVFHDRQICQIWQK